MSNTGTYRYDAATRQVVKVSDKIPKPHIPGWKRMMDPAGETRRANEAAGERALREIYSKE